MPPKAQMQKRSRNCSTPTSWMIVPFCVDLSNPRWTNRRIMRPRAPHHQWSHSSARAAMTFLKSTGASESESAEACDP